MAGSVIQGAVKRVGSDFPVVPDMLELEFDWTGDASDGTVPATGNAITNDANTAAIAGYYLLQAEVIPGSPSPTASYKVAVQDSHGVDLLDGNGATRSATLSARVLPTTAPSPVVTALTLVVTSNSAAGAKGAVILHFGRARW